MKFLNSQFLKIFQICFFSVTFFALTLLYSQEQWEPFNTGLYGGNVQAIALDPDDPDIVYIGTLGGGFFYSTDKGETWTQNNNGLENWNIHSLMVKRVNEAKRIYAGTDKGIYITEDLNGDWMKFNQLTDNYIHRLRDFICDTSKKEAFIAIVAPNSDINQHELYIIIDDKTSFFPDFEMSPYPFVNDAIPRLTKPYRPTEANNYFVATDTGIFYFDHNEVHSPNRQEWNFKTLALRPSGDSVRIYAGIEGNGGRFNDPGEKPEWKSQNKFLENEDIIDLEPYFFKSSANDANYLDKCYALTCPSLVSVGSGKIWMHCDNKGLPKLIPNAIGVSLDESRFNSIYVSNAMGVYFSINGGVSWTGKNESTLTAHRINSFCIDKSNRIRRIYTVTDGGIFYTESNNNWSNEQKWIDPNSNLLKKALISCVLINEQKNVFLVGTAGQGIYFKNDFNNDWDSLDCNGKSNFFVTDIEPNSDFQNIFVGTKTNGIFKVQSNLTSCENIVDNFNAIVTDIETISDFEDFIFFSTYDSGIYKYDISSPQPEPGINLDDIQYYSLTSFKKDGLSYLLAGSSEGIYYCDNINTFAWERYSDKYKDVKEIISIPSIDSANLIYFLATENDSEKIFRHIYDNNNLIQFTDELPDYQYQDHKTFCIDPDDPYLVYLGSGGSGVYKFRFDEPTTDNLIDTSTWDFGGVAVGAEKELTRIIENNNSFMPLLVKVSVNDLINWETNLIQPVLIYPGQSESVKVTFKPQQWRNFQDKLIITVQDIFDPPKLDTILQINLKGTGQSGEIKFTKDGQAFDTLFFKTHVGSIETMEIQFKKIGNVEITNVEIKEPSPPFSLIGNWEDSLSQNDSGDVSIEFAPTEIGDFADSIIITYKYLTGCSPDSISKSVALYLEGTGEDGIFSLSPDTIDSAKVPIGDESLDRKIILTNDGNLPVSLDTFYFANGNDSIFPIRTKIPDTIHKDSQNKISIYFSPKDTVAYNDILTFIYQDTYNVADIASVILKGEGITHLIEPIPPQGWNFGDVHVKDLPDTTEFYLKNIADDFKLMADRLYIDSVYNFSIIDWETKAISVNESSFVHLKFDPRGSQLGLYSDIINVEYSFWRTDSNYTSQAKKEVPVTATLVQAIPVLEDTSWESIIEVHVDSSKLDLLKIENKGTIDLFIDITGFNENSPFRLESPKKHTIPDSSHGFIKFSYTPRDTKGDSDALVVNYSDQYYSLGSETIIFKGVGADAIPELSISPADTMECHVEDATNMQIKIKNVGNIPIETCSLTITPKRWLTKTDTLFPEILPGETKILETIFHCDSVDTFDYQLKISYTDSLLDTVKTVDTSFTVITYGAILQLLDSTEAEIDSLDFDSCCYDMQCVTKTIRLKNIGNLMLNMDSITFINHDEFNSSRENDKLDIPPDTTVLFPITFCPKKPHRREGEVSYYFHDNFNEDIYNDVESLYLFGEGRGSLLEITKNDTVRCLVKEDTTFSLIIKNIGNCDGIIDNCYLENNGKYFNDINFSGSDTLKPWDSAKIDITFAPDNLGNYQCDLKIEYHDAEQRSTSRNLTAEINGEGYDNVLPVIKDITFGEPVLGEPLTVKAIVVDRHSGLKSDGVKLFWRKGGERQFFELDEKWPEKIDSTYMWTIPGENVTSRGIEFYIEATDTADDTAHQPDKKPFDYFSPPVRVPLPGLSAADSSGNPIYLPQGNAQQNYRLVSIPLNIDEDKRSAVNILFKSLQVQTYDEVYWRCAYYQYFTDENYGKYIYLNEPGFPDFEPGKSFFMLVHKDWPKQRLNSQSGYTVPTNSFFEIPLHEGVNFFANPFNFPIPLTNVRLADTSGMTECIDYYEDKIETLKTSLLPWTGYFVISDTIDTLEIWPDLRHKFPKSFATILSKKTMYKYFIKIEAQCDRAEDKENIAGVISGASEGFDRYDQPEFPPIGEFVMVGFPHEEWGRSNRYFAVDARPISDNGCMWEFVVYTNIKKSVKLSFRNISSVPENYQVKLLNAHLKINLDIRKNYEFQYYPGNQLKETFRLLVGDPEYVQKLEAELGDIQGDFNLTVNFPNPFNSSTKISLTLPKQEEVTIKIFNILGDLVKTLKKSENMGPGQYLIIWDGTDEHYQPVGSGLYFCRLKSKSYSKTVKMTLIR